MPDQAGRVRVLLVDDHLVVRTGLRMLIDSDPGCIVIGEAGDRESAFAAAAAAQPDVILLDIDLAGKRSTAFIEELQDCAPGGRILMLTGVRNTELHGESIRLGARGVLLKEEAAGSLLKAIRKVHEGELWLGQAVTAELVTALRQLDHPKPPNPEDAKIAMLTSREREVISLVAEGLQNREIADRLFISDTTVRHHLSAIFSKLDVRDRLGLALYAFRHRLALPK